ncbi:MAG: LysR family transcriptional regulator [Caulobacteraceae bacterium]|nr:LysR family transcriptional regulator [Caulobacteraceae bacterium]
MNNIRRLDGSLLLVFRELLAHRRATLAARRLGLSQSAVSHALGRLRALFDDPLFIRRPHGLEPTQRALELGPRIEALIDLVGETLSADTRFDPAHSRRRFNLAGPAFITSIIGARLVEQFRASAPNAAFLSRRLLLDLALVAVRRGEIDLALGAFARIPPDMTAETLYVDRYCVIARRDHPVVRPPLDRATYAATPHVFVGDPPGYASNEVIYDPDLMAETYGAVPPPEAIRTAAYVPQWETAMLIVSASDAIADCPGRLAERYAVRLGLQVIEPPYDPAMPPVQAVRRAGLKDPAIDWLLDQVRAAVA